MNGPQHYHEAELLLSSCQLARFGPGDAEQYPAREDGVDSIGNALKAAQVHAILAVAAAVATNDRLEGMSVDQLAEWLGALGEIPAVRHG